MSDNLQVVGLGMACLDLLVRLKEMPTWERGTRLGSFRFDGGGPVGTACVAAQRLGARVGFIGTAGTDESAEIKMRSFVREGVDLSRVVVRDGSENQVILVCVDEQTGERGFSGLRTFASAPILVDELDRDYITAADYLHLDGSHMQAAIQAAQWMRAAGKKVMLDGGKTGDDIRPDFRELVSYVDVLIAGSGFMPALTGKKDLHDAGWAALAMGPRIVVQTEGADGSYTFSAQGEFHTPIFDVPVVDTTGAGDVFHGAYLVGLLRGWDLRRIALFSTAVSALKCTRLGGRAGIPHYPEVIAFLRERNLEME
jgi:sulfofructose kinase